MANICDYCDQMYLIMVLFLACHTSASDCLNSCLEVTYYNVEWDVKPYTLSHSPVSDYVTFPLVV